MGERSGAPRASALHQSSFRNLRLRFNYRSQMSQLTVTHPTAVMIANRRNLTFKCSATTGLTDGRMNSRTSRVGH